MKTLGDRVVERAREVDSAICVGLDPRVHLIPAGVMEEARERSSRPDDPRDVTADAFRIFCCRVVDRVAQHAVAVKPQAAFFEACLSPGFAAFEDVCRYAASSGVLVIADVKRGDIGTTAQAYASAYLRGDSVRGPLVDAVTVNPFLGFDGVRPFLEAGRESGRGAFILVKTSNPSSRELQDLVVDDVPIHEHLARLVEGWNGSLEPGRYGSLGAVVGATWPEQLRQLRAHLLHAVLLIPGYGAQGGGPQDVVAGFDERGQGALVSASRSVVFPWAGAGTAPIAWEDAIEEATIAMKHDLRRALEARRP